MHILLAQLLLVAVVSISTAAVTQSPEAKAQSADVAETKISDLKNGFLHTNTTHWKSPIHLNLLSNRS